MRNALSAATLKAPLAVRSTAWVDESGRLHENTRVESGVQLRGVRVLAYLEKDGELEARLAERDLLTELGATKFAEEFTEEEEERLGTLEEQSLERPAKALASSGRKFARK